MDAGDEARNFGRLDIVVADIGRHDVCGHFEDLRVVFHGSASPCLVGFSIESAVGG